MVEVHTIRRNLRLVGFALITLAALATVSQAELYTYGFTRIEPHNASENIAAQLFVDVTNEGVLAGQTLFVFRNVGLVESTIKKVLFDDGALLGIAELRQDGTTVSFTEPASNEVLPEGEHLSPPFETTEGFSALAEPPPATWGVDPGEQLGIVFDLKESKTYLDVLASLASGDLRIGLHVISIGSNAESDAFVNDGVVPLPGAVLLGMLGMGAAGWRLRRFA